MRRLLPLLLLLLFALPAEAREILGKVVAIADGDTLTLLDDGRKQRRIRLAGIDTPESRQPYGSRARQALAELTFGRRVKVQVLGVDRYGRTLGRVIAGRKDVNAALVRQGAAWVYRAYTDDPALLRLEAEARAARRGLWALPEAQRQPPWEWRRRPATFTPPATRGPTLRTQAVLLPAAA
ncbi:thermonuclease family protein [Siccirubricoccus sp. KC 17139]|uniref:Thermonuclease family protein n=1 Tax=Siccirubricoccus soli TaxID=2899147 RepID=A0ABT1DA53_9PROT|nr:thermonuclease family protein [Siccirubricoccus soli]MCO6418786.1 thermonuclease family protein [Siccirubricoccus soli]MCP2684921.1 thermonuclease family protein [Siccirubricoccus soli]